MSFSFTDPNEKEVRGLALLDDIDTFHSPIDGAIVTVAQHQGVHVCWYCVKQFEQMGPMRGVEVKGGEWGTRIFLHAKCVGAKPGQQWGGFFRRAVDAIQSKRLIAKVTKPFRSK
jgi:hypothetical protein